jgi:serine/threonine protein phosphatase PrpC
VTRLTVESAMECGACSHTGRVRENNEDSFRAERELNLFVLSDGMGGAVSGEVASRQTVDAVVTHCQEADVNPSVPYIGKPFDGVTPITNRLASGIRLASRIVNRAARKHEAHRGMGATVVAVRCVDERMSIAHVGDSRLYLLRDDRLEQVTQDHSVSGEHVRRGRNAKQDSEASGLQNLLTRAIGVEEGVEVDVNEEVVLGTDTLLLCSDGLTRELSDFEIATLLKETEDVQEAADRLVRLANEKGGGDNITAIVLRQRHLTTGLFSGIRRLGRWFWGPRAQT